MIATEYAQKGRRIITFHADTTIRYAHPKKRKHDMNRDITAGPRALLRRKLYLNPQLNWFLTLTYRDQNATPAVIQNDFKNAFSKHHIAYVAVIECHKSGNLHAHAVIDPTNAEFERNRYGYYSFKYWTKGFSQAKKITYRPSDTDQVAIALYISKYISKSSQRIGGKWFFSSRGLLSAAQKSNTTYDDNLFQRDAFRPFVDRRYNGCKFRYKTDGTHGVSICYNTIRKE